jgi:hypothetical protein
VNAAPAKDNVNAAVLMAAYCCPFLLQLKVTALEVSADRGRMRCNSYKADHALSAACCLVAMSVALCASIVLQLLAAALALWLHVTCHPAWCVDAVYCLPSTTQV